MKMGELKAKTYAAWECLSKFKSALIQPKNFKPEMRRIGDMRCKATWERAYARFVAQNIMDCFEGCYSLITFHFNPAIQGQVDPELLSLVLDEFLAHRDGVELVREGLEQIFEDSTDAEAKGAAHEFLELVARGRAAGAGSFNGLPVNSRRVVGASSSR